MTTYDKKEIFINNKHRKDRSRNRDDTLRYSTQQDIQQQHPTVDMKANIHNDT